jgi:hypothetical protein
VLLAEKVRRVDPEAGLGLNTAVTPCGRPETENVTLPLNPYWPLTLTFSLAVLPCPMLTVPKPESVKVGVKTARVTVVVFVRLPDVPVMVNVLVAMLAELLAVNVRVLSPVVGFGENEPVTPAGNPETARLTLPEKPYRLLT